MWHRHVCRHAAQTLKKEWNNAICNNMDTTRNHYSQWSQSKISTMWYHLYVAYKIWYKWTSVWNRHRLTDIENTRGRQGERLGEGWSARRGLADVSCYSRDGWMAERCSEAQRAAVRALWWTAMGKNIKCIMCNWVTLLHGGNSCNTVSQLHFSEKEMVFYRTI